MLKLQLTVKREQVLFILVINQMYQEHLLPVDILKVIFGYVEASLKPEAHTWQAILMTCKDYNNIAAPIFDNMVRYRLTRISYKILRHVTITYNNEDAICHFDFTRDKRKGVCVRISDTDLYEYVHSIRKFSSKRKGVYTEHSYLYIPYDYVIGHDKVHKTITLAHGNECGGTRDRSPASLYGKASLTSWLRESTASSIHSMLKMAKKRTLQDITFKITYCYIHTTLGDKLYNNADLTARERILQALHTHTITEMSNVNLRQAIPRNY